MKNYALMLFSLFAIANSKNSVLNCEKDISLCRNNSQPTLFKHENCIDLIKEVNKIEVEFNYDDTLQSKKQIDRYLKSILYSIVKSNKFNDMFKYDQLKIVISNKEEHEDKISHKDSTIFIHRYGLLNHRFTSARLKKEIESMQSDVEERCGI